MHGALTQWAIARRCAQVIHSAARSDLRLSEAPSVCVILQAWQPILTPQWVIITFLIIGIPFVIIGFVLKAASDKVQIRGAGCSTSCCRVRIAPLTGCRIPPAAS